MAGKRIEMDVLLVEDNPGDVGLIEHHFASPATTQFLDPTLTHVDTLTAGRKAIRDGDHDVVLLDLGLPESDGLDTLQRVLADDPSVPIIVLTGLESQDVAVEAIKRGAQDYLPKGDLDGDRLLRALRYAVERHKQEQTLQRQTEQMEFFNSVLRHDILNGMSVIHSRATLLADRLDEDRAESAELIVDWSDDIIELTRTVRATLETLTGDETPDLCPINLSAVVEEETSRVEGLPGVADVTVDVSSDLYVRADDLLADVVGNLLTNAVEHAHEPVSITITARTVDDRVVLRVADDGPGVPPEQRESIFKRGAKGDLSGGTGFGLFFVASMVEIYEGHVSVEESETGGAAFVVELDRA